MTNDLGTSILQLCTRMQQAKTSRQIRDLGSEALQLLGWESWVYVGNVAVRMAQTSSVLFASNYPLTWLAEYRFRNYYGIDPVVHHVMTHDLPLVWHADPDKWDHLDPDGWKFLSRLQARNFTGGVGVPVHTLVTRGFLIAATSKPMAEMDESIERIQLYGLLLGNNLHEALYRISFPDRVRLSEMQMKVLQWVAEGASAEVVASKLGIKVTTVLYHITQAQKKLKVRNIGAKNRQELITKAYAMGYLNSVLHWGEDTVLNIPELEGKLVEVWEREVKEELKKSQLR